MTFSQYWELVRADCFRYTGQTSFYSIVAAVVGGESVKYVFWLRTCAYFNQNRYGKYLIYPVARLLLWHYKYKMGIQLSFRTKIGAGLYLPHFGGIVINEDATIGSNCVISQNVTIGKNDRGARSGVPTLGERVFVGPGAVLSGNITVGNNAMIAANSFVDFDVKDDEIVVGNPGRVVSTKGAGVYIKRPWSQPHA